MATTTGTGTKPGEPGVLGESKEAEGVHGIGHKGAGVSGTSEKGFGTYAESQESDGVHGVGHKGAGVSGTSEKWIGTYGESQEGEGVRGISHSAGHGGVVGINDNPTDQAGQGVYGESNKGEGVRGISHSTYGGVVGINDHVAPAPAAPTTTNIGLQSRNILAQLHIDMTTGLRTAPDLPNGGWFECSQGEGVCGISHSIGSGGVVGINDNNAGSGVGVFGRSESGEGVHGESNSMVLAALVGIQLNANSTTPAIWGEHKGKGPAGYFKGDVVVTGDINLINAADCAEDFNVSEIASLEPGTVMVLGEEEVLQPSHQAYDKRVAGVISGAGNYKPGIILDKQTSAQRRLPVALLGKVFCKVDAQFGAIEVGDLLTTSSTQGHAMKANDPSKAFGSVIGKALRSLDKGQGLIPILIALQ
jgi:hypothetical protein